jgi:hypothetical protein
MPTGIIPEIGLGVRETCYLVFHAPSPRPWLASATVIPESRTTDLNLNRNLFLPPAAGAKEQDKCAAGFLIIMGGNRQLVRTAFGTFDVKMPERTVRRRPGDFIFFLAHKPALRIDRHETTLRRGVGQWLSNAKSSGAISLLPFSVSWHRFATTGSWPYDVK